MNTSIVHMNTLIEIFLPLILKAENCFGHNTNEEKDFILWRLINDFLAGR